MENKINESLLETKIEMKEIIAEMKREFEMIHKRIDGLENQMLQGFREIKHVINEKRSSFTRSLGSEKK